MERTCQRFAPRLKGGVGLVPRMSSVRIFVFPIHENHIRNSKHQSIALEQCAKHRTGNVYSERTNVESE
uniref:Uncharacterized protein n=1 Tax=Candidatus Kentrum sp. TUN TaxID=2126343 RepID=A0A450ZSR8_9GAMM|nr:MAG: hypothetical protein BECKTUN1418D_GA0071000_105310 [Candidatus Kentron sp. TUN]